MGRRRKKNGTFIRIRTEVKLRLFKAGRKNESYSDIISRLIGKRRWN